MRAAAWFAAQSFHGASSRPAAVSAPQPAAYVDTRPRRDYILPSGELVTLVHDHGEEPRPTRTVALAGGKIVTAELSPVSAKEIDALLGYACGPNVRDQSLRYVAYAALHGVSSRAAFEPLTADERKRAIFACAAPLEMLRIMGVKLDAEPAL